MTPRAATRLALAMVGACVALTVASLILVGPIPDAADIARALSDLAYRLHPIAMAPLGALVVSRRPTHPIGWLLLGTAVSEEIKSFVQAYATYGLDAAHPLAGAVWAAWIQAWVGIGEFALVFAILHVFPTGTAVSRRWRRIGVASVVATVLIAPLVAVHPGPLTDLPEVNNPLGLQGPAGDLVSRVLPFPLILLLPLLLVVSAASVLVRFWRSTGIERQQLKCFGYALAMVILTYVVSATDRFGSGGDLISEIGFLCLPVGIALAVLRYRLFEIDRIINRTLVYGLLTAVLALVYWASVILLQQVLRPVTQGSDLAIVGSTLAVAAVFQPFRTRIQQEVDHRFYRRRYDAARELAGFSSRLRNEVDLDSLGAELLTVVVKTMQPERLSLWLKPVERGRR